jgi:hypothetical protein
VLDSLLTLTKGAVFWMLGGIVLCIALDRAVAMASGLPVTMFLVLAAAILGFLAISGMYTIMKLLRRRKHSD